MDNFNPLRKLKNIGLAITGTVLMSTSALGQSQEKSPGNPGKSMELVDSSSQAKSYREQDPHLREAYLTKDGNYRHYHNPKSGWFTDWGEERVDYSLGTTESPFNDLEEMKQKTPVPKSLTETDFFINYVNAKYQVGHVLTDSITGNHYYDFLLQDSSVTGVVYQGDRHWNIQRFLIDAHYRDFYVPKDRARVNALFDMYRYFLYQRQGNRDHAWQDASDFIAKEVDPIVNGKFNQWFAEKGLFVMTMDRPIETWDKQYYIRPPSLFSEDDHTELVDIAMRYNEELTEHLISGTPVTEQELEEALTNYNIEYRKKGAATARIIARQAIADRKQGIANQIEVAKAKPVLEERVIQEGHYPEGYDSWDPIIQEDWREANPDKVRIFQEAYTEEDRAKELHFLEEYRLH